LLRPDRRTLVCALLVALLTVALAFLDHSKIWFVAAGGLAAIAFLVSGHAFEKSLLLTVVVCCLLPNEGIRRVVKLEELFPLAAVLVFLVRHPAPGTRAASRNWTERWIALLVVVALIGAIRGCAAGRQTGNVVDEFALFADFVLAAIVARSVISDRWIRAVFWALAACTAFVSLTYLWIFVAGGGHVRAASDQQHLLNVAIPVLSAVIILTDSIRNKLGAAALMLPMIPAVYVTQTRALWLYVPFSIVLLAVMLAAHRHIRARGLLVFTAFVGAAALVVLSYTMLTRGVGAGHQALAERAGSLKNLSADLSLASRVDLGFQAFARFARSPILGQGLGDYLHYRIMPIPDRIFSLDFSYMWVLWKLGIAGLVPLLGFYFLFLKRTWFVYRQTTDLFQRAAAAGVLVGFVALLMLGFESGILIVYRFNLVWAILMGSMESWTRQIKFDLAAGAEP
jgi:hypothetical protein